MGVVAEVNPTTRRLRTTSGSKFTKEQKNGLGTGTHVRTTRHE